MMCATPKCPNKRLFTSELCEPCHDRLYNDIPAVPVPRTFLYESTCLLCSRQEYFNWSTEQVKHIKPHRCQTCGGKMIVTPADFRTDSPRTGQGRVPMRGVVSL